MPKQQQSIRDFSGGINRGSNKKNLKDNQLVESRNFIADSVGQVTTIQDETGIAQNSLDANLPLGNQRNIHAWKSDTDFIISGQSSNIATPTVTELQASVRARVLFYFSSEWGTQVSTNAIADGQGSRTTNGVDGYPGYATVISVTDSTKFTSQGKITFQDLHGHTQILSYTGVDYTHHKFTGVTGWSNTHSVWQYHSAGLFALFLTNQTISQYIHQPVGDRSFEMWNEDKNEIINIIDRTIDETSGYKWHDALIQGLTVKKLEDLANKKTSVDYDSTIHGSIDWNWKTYDPSSTDAVSYDSTNNTNKLSTSTAYSNAVDGVNKFVVLRDTTEGELGGATSNIADYPSWKMEMVFDYYGQINILVPDSSNSWKATRTNDIYQSSLEHEIANGNITDGSLTMKWQDWGTKYFMDGWAGTFNQRPGAYNFSMNDNPHYGAFSKWKWAMGNVDIKSGFTYTVAIQVYTNVIQTGFETINLSYTSIYGDTVEEIIAGLYAGEEDKIGGGTEAHQVFWKRVDGGVEIYQDSRTEIPYGIKTITVTRTSETDNSSSLTEADRDRRFIAIANSNATATIYQMENDQWMNWAIDLREDDTVTTSSPDLSFFDAEGNLFVCDSTMKANHKPRFFGMFTFNKTYLETDVNADGYEYTDLCPTPYEELIDTGAVAKHYSYGTNSPKTPKYKEQWSHMAFDPETADSFFNVTASESGETLNYNVGDSKIFFRKNSSGIIEDTNSVNVRGFDQNFLLVEKTGLKLYCQFTDEATNTDEDKDKIAGSFQKSDSVEFYWNYVYHGGYISKPKRFQVDGVANSTNFQSSSPANDNCAMGVMVMVGKQLLGGTGSGMYNSRLKGIEIWAKYSTSPGEIYSICDIDLNKGWRSSLNGDWMALSNKSFFGSGSPLSAYTTGDMSSITPVAKNRSNYMIYTVKNTIESFTSRYELHYGDDIGFNAVKTGWKTACMFNRRAYYGNVSIIGKDGTVNYFPDGILKSAKGMYSTVGVSNLIEASINDGDEITSLQVVGNKLLQFKRHGLTIMGIKILENGESREVIEQIVHQVGVESDSQVCQTPYGLFWVSRSGIYLYNGELIERLTENPEGSTISKSEWESFYGKRLHCGYDAYWNQVLIARDTVSNNKTLIFSFNNRAFSSSDSLFTASKKTGFAQTGQGHLMWAEEFENSSNSGIDVAQTNRVYQTTSSVNNKARQNQNITD